jgi:predicted transcriptional regulator
MGFLSLGSSLSSGSSLTIKVDSYRISWNLIESYPVTIEVGFRSGSASCQ